MDVVNFPAIVANGLVLDQSQINQTSDLVLIGKKVNNLRDGSQYQETAITVENFLSMVPQTTINSFQTSGSTLSQAKELAIGLNDVTVVAPDGAVYLPVTAPVGSIVKVVSDENYSIFSITGAIIGTFGNGTAIAPTLDSNSVNLCVEYIKHSNGTWRYSCNHTEL
jgi:hypothetical protein